MLLKRFYDEKLAQASYLIGCQKTGEAIVVDANNDIAQYVDAAKSEGLRIVKVTETHIHADFVSGSRELAFATGAELLLSGEGGSDWQYAFAAADGARLLSDDDIIMVGNVQLSVRHTPGHTPEHIVFVVTDTATTDRPMGMLSGDFIFVGDVGRPDLLERAANIQGTMDASARQLFASIRATDPLPDYLQIWPGHGAGSACGKALGAVPFSTLGYERLTNWAFAQQSEDDFVQEVLAGQPEPPAYFAAMKRINRDGPETASSIREMPRIDDDHVRRKLDANEIIIDSRPAAEYAAHHIPGTINIPLGRNFYSWLGSLIPFGSVFYLLDEKSRVDRAAADLRRIGFDSLAGYFERSAVDAYAKNGALESTRQISVQELAERMEARDVHVIDVRGNSEWNAGHIEGVPNIPLGELPKHLAEISRDQPIALHCQGGSRSAIAASLLKAHGFTDVSNVTGGYQAWERSFRSDGKVSE